MSTDEVFTGPVFMDLLWFLVLWPLFSLGRILLDRLGHLPAASHSVPPKVDEAITTPGSFSLSGSVSLDNMHISLLTDSETDTAGPTPESSNGPDLPQPATDLGEHKNN